MKIRDILFCLSYPIRLVAGIVMAMAYTIVACLLFGIDVIFRIGQVVFTKNVVATLDYNIVVILFRLWKELVWDMPLTGDWNIPTMLE